MTRKSYFGRLFNRPRRFGLSLLALAAAGGLVVAVWTGPASAAGFYAKHLAVRTAINVDGATSGPTWIKACGPGPFPYQFGEVCTEWTEFTSFDFVNPFPNVWWQGNVTICKDDTAVTVEVPNQEEGITLNVDLSQVEPGDAPLPESCDGGRPRG